MATGGTRGPARGRGTLALLVVLALAAGAWWLSRPGRGTSSGRGAELARERGAPEDRPLASAAAPDSARVPDESATAAIDAAPPALATGAFVLEVVDEAGHGVPGARVTIEGFRGGTREEPYRHERTGPDGTVRVPSGDLDERRAAAGDAWPLVLAAALFPADDGAAWVELPRPLADARVRLVASAAELARLRPLRVRVLDRHGAPVGGVEVQLAVRREIDPDFGRPCASGVTRAIDGGAELDLADYHQLRQEVGDSGGRLVHRVQAWVPFAKLPRAELGLELPDDLVTLELPPFAALDVRVLQGGREQTDDAFVQLVAPCFAGHSLLAALRAELSGGRVRFPCVGLGVRLQLLATRAGCERRPPSRAPTPTREGETLVAEVELGREMPRLHALAVDEHGEPWEQQSFTQHLDGDADDHIRGSVQSDASGRVLVRASRAPRAGARTLVLAAPARAGRPAAEVRFELPAELGDELDLGPAVFPRAAILPDLAPGSVEPSETLLAGIVVDEQGRGIGAAYANASQDGARHPAYSQTDARGAFTVVGCRIADVVGLVAGAHGFLPTQLSGIAVGTRDVRVVLRRAAVFEAHVPISPGIPRERLQLVLIDSDGRHELPAREHVRADGLEPGEYALEVSAAPGAWVLERHEGIALAPGANPPERRFDPLDLRGRLALVRVRLEDPDGTPFHGHVTLRSGKHWVSALSAGRPLVWVVPADAELELFAGENAPLPVVPAPFEQVLRLLPAPR